MTYVPPCGQPAVAPVAVLPAASPPRKRRLRASTIAQDPRVQEQLKCQRADAASAAASSDAVASISTAITTPHQGASPQLAATECHNSTGYISPRAYMDSPPAVTVCPPTEAMLAGVRPPSDSLLDPGISQPSLHRGRGRGRGRGRAGKRVSDAAYGLVRGRGGERTALVRDTDASSRSSVLGSNRARGSRARHTLFGRTGGRRLSLRGSGRGRRRGILGSTASAGVPDSRSGRHLHAAISYVPATVKDMPRRPPVAVAAQAAAAHQPLPTLKVRAVLALNVPSSC